LQSVSFQENLEGVRFSLEGTERPMHRKPIASSAISSVAYDPESSVLEVEFRSGAVYDYFKVPPRVYKALLDSPSKGSFVSRRIRDRYPFVRRDH
jgi:hypothetical protein